MASLRERCSLSNKLAERRFAGSNESTKVLLTLLSSLLKLGNGNSDEQPYVSCRLCDFFRARTAPPVRDHVFEDHLRGRNVRLVFDVDEVREEGEEEYLDDGVYVARWTVEGGGGEVMDLIRGTLFACRFCYRLERSEDKARHHLEESHAISGCLEEDEDRKNDSNKLPLALSLLMKPLSIRDGRASYRCTICDYENSVAYVRSHLTTVHLHGRNLDLKRSSSGSGSSFDGRRHEVVDKSPDSFISDDFPIVRWVIGDTATLYACRHCLYAHEEEGSVRSHLLQYMSTDRMRLTKEGVRHGFKSRLGEVLDTLMVDTHAHFCKICGAVRSKKRSARSHLLDVHLRGKNVDLREGVGDGMVDVCRQSELKEEEVISRWRLGDGTRLSSCRLCDFTWVFVDGGEIERRHAEVVHPEERRPEERSNRLGGDGVELRGAKVLKIDGGVEVICIE